MLPPTLGDLSGFLSSRHSNVRLKQQIQQHSHELTTGLAFNTSRHLGGDMSQLAIIEHDLRLSETMRQTNAEAILRSGAKQSALGLIDQHLDVTFEALATVGLNEGALAGNTASATAGHAFRSIVDALNTQAGHQSLFAGSATDHPALIDADTMFADLRTALTGLSTLTDVDVTLENWFDNPTGAFATLAYTGDGGDPPAFQLSADTFVSDGIRADDDRLRTALKAVAKAALAYDPSIGLSDDLARAMTQSAVDAVFVAKDGLIEMRAELGAIEERIEAATVENSARKTALDVARNQLLGVDSYDAASRLEATQFQLESLYATTARLSRLSLLEYLR